MRGARVKRRPDTCPVCGQFIPRPGLAGHIEQHAARWREAHRYRIDPSQKPPKKRGRPPRRTE